MTRLAVAMSGSLLLFLGAVLFILLNSSDVAAYAPVGSSNLIPHADFHLWKVNEIFSCADGSIQFIEFTTEFDGQHVLAGHELRATNLNSSQTHSFIFPANSPTPTLNKSLLIATGGFGSLPGGVTPDYVIPANFLFTEGGSISLVGADTLNYGAGQLPLDGVNSLSPGGITGPNSPTNFAGQTGSIACPPSLAVSKQAPATIISGSLMTYTLTVTGSGATSNTNVILTDTIPAGTSFASAEVDPVGGVLTWALGDMSSPLTVVSRTFVVTVEAPAGGTVTNSNYGVQSDQTGAVGAAVQVSVISADTNELIFLPIIFKDAGAVDEHAADLMPDSR
jgi:uncharacterized repeat protein (TIGR01451 family)